MILLSLIAHLVAVASPGPDTFIVMRQTLASGFKAGLSSAIGIGLGILIHCSLALYGLSALILSDPLGGYIPYIGSIYLIFLGVQSVASRNISLEDNKNTLDRRSLLIGFFTNILNLKAFIFFVSLFSALTLRYKTYEISWLIIYFSLATTAWFIFLAYFLSIPSIKKIYTDKVSLINKILGIILIIIGLLVLINIL